ncbi:phosphoribosyltransferase family protein [Flavihumibacter petaseus]|uniref:Putative ribose-phosphate pyrophosphokinase n=1 Tax=Flavihumibacter petaseus NBRC 106054 TaxID=1220578 RepID=A0A0E9N086_9BACT|nr:phosphoribosyltransferase family protein [Flavihumibacter petaseus]GAO43193.1 putative ribose-phosphate pyrophosphokinase [Flavihumibacter petaseus NBRC 106054]
MNTLNLVSPEKSDLQFTTMIFPDGQPHIKINPDDLQQLDHNAPIRILTRMANANDILLALFVKNTLDYHEFEHIELHITYLLCARMDRVMTGGEPFSLKVIAAMINQAQFRKVKIFDPHSEVTTAMIERSYAVTNHDYVQQVLAETQPALQPDRYYLVSPDAGALKKIHGLAQHLGITHLVECMKEREVKTGKLTGFTTTATSLSGATCFIVDDICDGGGTFVGTAALLKQKGAAAVHLIVSHGIFSKGTTLENIDRIYSTNSYREVSGIHCLPVERFL